MSGILFVVFSGHASGIFDNFLFTVHKRHIAKKTGQEIFVPQLFSIETQWDSGGNTEYMLMFNDWLDQKSEFLDIFGGNFILPPPMGDVKTQISRWSKILVQGDFGKTISSLISNRHNDIEDAILELKSLLTILRRLSPDIFLIEDRINFLDKFIKFYSEFSILNEVKVSHSVGNLFINFMYYYSFLLIDTVETIYEHHHQAFFNFLKDLNLVPRGNRIEFLIDGRYNLSGVSEDGVIVPTEKFFDDYPASSPVKLDSYNIQAIDGSDIENKFQALFEKSDIVVIPPGSLSNWLPLINKFSALLKTKPLLWFVNAFTHFSEASLEKQIKYLHSVGLNPIMLAPKLNNAFDELNEDERSTYEQGYIRQEKHAIDFGESLKEFKNIKVLRCIPLKELEPGEGGIKYSPLFVEFLLLRLSEKIDGIKINNDIVFSKIQEVIDEYSSIK